MDDCGRFHDFENLIQVAERFIHGNSGDRRDTKHAEESSLISADQGAVWQISTHVRRPAHPVPHRKQRSCEPYAWRPHPGVSAGPAPTAWNPQVAFDPIAHGHRAALGFPLPITNMYGIIRSWASRILAPIFSGR